MNAHCPACDRRVGGRGVRALKLDSDFSSRSGQRFPAPDYAECDRCRILVSLDRFPPERLAEAYAHAAFRDARDESAAAKTYVSLLPRDTYASVLEIGCGEGAFLRALRERGSGRLLGFEPDRAVRTSPGLEIRPEAWDAARDLGETFDLVACLQTLEHLPDPRAQLRSFRRHMKPDGLLFLCCHDPSHAVNRAMGKASPIFDPQHFHLFSPEGLRHLLNGAGFSVRRSRSYWNRYPISTWARLAPGPRTFKRAIGLLPGSLPLPAGNFFVLAARAETV